MVSPKDSDGLLLFARSAACLCLPPRGKLPEVLAAALRRSAAALVPHDCGGRHLRVPPEIIGEGQRRAEQFTASRRAILWKGICGTDEEIYFGQNILEGFDAVAVWHTLIVGPVRGKKQALAVAVSTHFSDTTERIEMRCRERGAFGATILPRIWEEARRSGRMASHFAVRTLAQEVDPALIRERLMAVLSTRPTIPRRLRRRQ